MMQGMVFEMGDLVTGGEVILVLVEMVCETVTIARCCAKVPLKI